MHACMIKSALVMSRPEPSLITSLLAPNMSINFFNLLCLDELRVGSLYDANILTVHIIEHRGAL
jgi:hypothetical protein